MNAFKTGVRVSMNMGMHCKSSLRRLWVLAACTAALLATGVAPAGADAVDDEARFVEMINADRRADGAGPLVVLPELVDKARTHAQRMVEADAIFHSGDMAEGLDGWKLLGENVGRGGNIESLHQAFMDSPDHRRNVLDPRFDAVGIGVVWKEGVPYVVELFMDSVEELRVQFTPPFADDDGSVHEEDIISLYSLGVTKGCDTNRYCPERKVTRGEMATMLVRAFGLTGSSGDVFGDDDTSVHASAIETLAANGITNGCEASSFCPDRPVTRGEMATFLSRILELPKAPSAGFTDTATNVHADAIDSLAAAGITRGCSEAEFCPYSNVTRAQLASFLIRALES